MKKEIIDIIIIIKIKELLNSIQSNFKDLITDKNKEEEMKHIVENIKYLKYDNKTKNKKDNTNIKNNKKKENTKEKTIKIDYRESIEINDRCEGRIWGKITENNKKKNYGYRCKNKKQKNSKYCFVHNYKLTHGNILEEPDKFIKHHFETFYLNKKNNTKFKKIKN